jgi:hypothetical protein
MMGMRAVRLRDWPAATGGFAGKERPQMNAPSASLGSIHLWSIFSREARPKAGPANLGVPDCFDLFMFFMTFINFMLKALAHVSMYRHGDHRMYSQYQ